DTSALFHQSGHLVPVLWPEELPIRVYRAWVKIVREADVRPEEHAVLYRYALGDEDEGLDFDPLPKLHPLADLDERADGGSFADLAAVKIDEVRVVYLRSRRELDVIFDHATTRAL